MNFLHRSGIELSNFLLGSGYYLKVEQKKKNEAIIFLI